MYFYFCDLVLFYHVITIPQGKVQTVHLAYVGIRNAETIQ
jgi:hypothetical protein